MRAIDRASGAVRTLAGGGGGGGGEEVMDWWKGMEGKGVERNGMEWNGMEWNGMEWTIVSSRRTHARDGLSEPAPDDAHDDRDTDEPGAAVAALGERPLRAL